MVSLCFVDLSAQKSTCSNKADHFLGDNASDAKSKIIVPAFLRQRGKELAKIAASVEELRATNQTEHERLAKEARGARLQQGAEPLRANAQLSTDGQFLDHVREIIRFFKTA